MKKTTIVLVVMVILYAALPLGALAQVEWPSGSLGSGGYSTWNSPNWGSSAWNPGSASGSAGSWSSGWGQSSAPRQTAPRQTAPRQISPLNQRAIPTPTPRPSCSGATTGSCQPTTSYAAEKAYWEQVIKPVQYTDEFYNRFNSSSSEGVQGRYPKPSGCWCLSQYAIERGAYPWRQCYIQNPGDESICTENGWVYTGPYWP